ncbi:MAG: prepilin-type N-terminal cleavage/methylation domain-containing protein [Piscinibacter sp.]|uniref:prepilin-type N-terminal cleavage/methylation domain-containing protein n=1 Tax=Piscinibacter TaxID=1114981 RepID=UPI000FDDFF82|nr:MULTISPECIES: prepilin-type N-terminal cleavage/methylation domain-containing protein [Piscinibacter]MCW5665592.1 prepilin-type N-terminal cleavage/methylation domain-containing protein [Piscinibacter sp.]
MATLRKSCRGTGFTLIEMLIALVLAGVITAIALPAYSRHVNRGRTAKAIADIKSIEMGLERFMTARGRYPASLAEAGITLTDPWGRAYRYLNMEGAKVGQVRKDRSLHPLNTDYDLYSVGPDGKSATPLTAAISRDDIVRARNGSFVGPAKDY